MNFCRVTGNEKISMVIWENPDAPSFVAGTVRVGLIQ
jgi:hypothetical protein